MINTSGSRPEGSSWTFTGSIPCQSSGQHGYRVRVLPRHPDLANAFEVVKGMRLVPFTAATVTQIAAFTLAPVLPLTLTMMPLEDVFKRLLTLLF